MSWLGSACLNALVLPAFGCCIPLLLVPKMVLTLCNLCWWCFIIYRKMIHDVIEAHAVVWYELERDLYAAICDVHQAGVSSSGDR